MKSPPKKAPKEDEEESDDDEELAEDSEHGEEESDGEQESTQVNSSSNNFEWVPLNSFKELYKCSPIYNLM